MKIYFQAMKVYFQALKIYFQGLKILFEAGKIYFRNVYRQFVGRIFGCWLLAVCRSVVAVGIRAIVTSVYI